MGEWQKLHAPFGPLSVNLAGAQLGQPQLIERLEQLLEQSGLEPSRLQLEITESFIMNQTEEALAVLHGLKRLGVQLAIDDFGTGYSLSYLKRLPLDILKIDKSFIRGLPDDPHDAAITRAIIALGRSMQLTVIAEGVKPKVSRASSPTKAASRSRASSSVRRCPPSCSPANSSNRASRLALPKRRYNPPTFWGL